MCYLAVAISAGSVVGSCQQIDLAVKSGAEMLELRTDYIDDLTVSKVLELLDYARRTSLPVLVTCRDASEGGKNNLPHELRLEVLIAAINAGADYIDCEFANFSREDFKTPLMTVLGDNAEKLILSAHNFEGTFDDLSGLYAEMKNACAGAIPKIVYTASHINDCFDAFKLLMEADGPATVLCMGQAGLLSRVLAKKFGAFATYAAIDDASATAPGQLTVKALKTLYCWDSIKPDTELFGVIGDPVGHSLSPAIFNACFDSADYNGLYLPVLVQGQAHEFDEFIKNVLDIELEKAHIFSGFSVTIPHKAHALEYVERVGEFMEPLAANIGAVNTLKTGFGGRVSGFNTDYAGAIDALCAEMAINKHQLHSVKVAVVGAGGVARALVAGLTDVGADVTIYNRTVAKAQALAEEFKCRSAGLDAITSMDAKVIVNCTSIGMYPKVDASPVPKECLKDDMAVFDTVYNPIETKLLREAAQAGLKTVNGAEMFIRQAMAQYKIFTGTDGNEDIMRKTVFDCLGLPKAV